MRIRGKTRHYTDGGVGFELARLFTCKTSILRPSLRIGFHRQSAWSHANKLTASLVGRPGQFTVTGTKKHRNFATLGANFTGFMMEKFYATLAYNGNFSKKDQIHEGLVRFGWKF